MKLWLDDIRTPPVGWTWVKTADECIEALKAGGISYVSLDHDLADLHYGGDYGKEKTGYDVVLFLEENPEYVPERINIHSLNPVGVDRMRKVCEKIAPVCTVISALQKELI